jgi:hypothetical protein
MHVVTAENYEEAQDAIRDILMMYVDMAESYQGFGHAVDVFIRFNPLKFVDCEQDGGDYAGLVDLDLLRTGSAIAILSGLYDLWSEVDAIEDEAVGRAIEAGKLKFVPDVEAVASKALRCGPMKPEDAWFDDAVAPIYRCHVLGYFSRLASLDGRV